jgi:hypoxanthine phosphoribosyltransferase
METNTIQIHNKTFQKFLHQEQIEKRIAEITHNITQDYANSSPVFIIVLNGAFMFGTEIIKNFKANCEVQFVKLISYVGTESSGEVITGIDIVREKIIGKDVVILEDIIDSGITMEFFVDYLYEQCKPKSVEVACLLFKPDNLKKDLNLKYVGFSIPPLFVVGYGLDYNDLGRNLTDIYQIVND